MLTLNKLKKPMCFFISEAEYFPRISVKKKEWYLKKKKKKNGRANSLLLNH